MKTKELVSCINEISPFYLTEKWDNTGLLIGNEDETVKKIMTCLDITDEVIEDAIEKGCNVIISHHPIIFTGLKAITSLDKKNKRIIRLIQNNISVIACHTNFDVSESSINQYLSDEFRLINQKNLIDYHSERLVKIVIYVPVGFSEKVRNAICDVGAGDLGHYSNCTFQLKGIGTFKPNENTKPFIGTNGKLEKVDEVRLETIVEEYNISKVLNAIMSVHPYEEPAYDIYPVLQNSMEYGLGSLGELIEETSTLNFIDVVKSTLDTDYVRVVGMENKERIKKVAIFCGSFDIEYEVIKKSGIDVLITGDVKYHIAHDLKDLGIVVIDAGHFNTEKFFIKLMKNLLLEKNSEYDIITFENNDVFKTL